MEIRNLISFVHVAEMNSFTKAAEVLGYSQSTISFQIKQLETEFDCLLFERINHTITLTDKGRELLEYAHSINTLTEEFVEIILADSGPGIADIDKAMQEGFSTAPDSVRSLGFGAGMGLPNMKRYTDEMSINSIVGKGTTVTMKVYIK